MLWKLESALPPGHDETQSGRVTPAHARFVRAGRGTGTPASVATAKVAARTKRSMQVTAVIVVVLDLAATYNLFSTQAAQRQAPFVVRVHPQEPAKSSIGTTGYNTRA